MPASSQPSPSTLNGAPLDARLRWFLWSHLTGPWVRGACESPPQRAPTSGSARTTALRRDNGHFLYLEAEGDSCTDHLRCAPAPVHQYDQAGLMLRCLAQLLDQDLGRAEPEAHQQAGAPS